MEYGLWIMEMDYGIIHNPQSIIDYGLRNMEYGLWILDYGLWNMDCGRIHNP